MSEDYEDYNYDDEYESGPIDSDDAYAMGLRAARCNGCKYAKLKYELGEKFLYLTVGGWPTVYELDAEPLLGQGKPMEHEGRSIRFHAGFMSIGHSNECYNWQPPKEAM